MILAAIIPAQPGWKVLLTTREGKPSIIDVERWGISFSAPNHLIPLDYMDRDWMSKPNFVMLLNPNKPPFPEKEIVGLCYDMAVAIGWVKAAN